MSSAPVVKRSSISRKDTIIIAVLVNSMLLALLFAFATKEEVHVPVVPALKEEHTVKNEVAKEPVDELDQIIHEYVLKAEAQKQEKPVAKAASEKVEEEYYVLKSGDNPWKIARKFHLSFEALLTLNHLDEESAKNLKPGDKIRIR